MPTVETVLQGFTVATDQGGPGLCGVYLIRGKKTFLVDPSHLGRRRQLLQAFETLKIDPDKLDAVVLTHLNWDHALNIDLFPNTKVLVHAKEWEYVQNPKPNDWATPRYMPEILGKHHLETFTGELQIDDGVRIIETPGHTAGHCSVVVDTPDGRAVIAGDALPNARSVRSRRPSFVFWDEAEAAASIDKIVAAGDIMYPGHDRPFRIKDGATHYFGKSKITIVTVPEPNEDDLAITIATQAQPPFFVLK